VRALPLRAWLLAIGSGVLQVLVFPSFSLYAACWIALAPLLVAILAPLGARQTSYDERGRNLTALTTWQGFLLGYVCGIIWYAGSCFWVYHVMHVYGGLSAPVAAGVLLLFCLYLALYHGAFAALLARAARHNDPRSRQRAMIRALALTPFLWVAIELARSRITGFPWSLLGTAQVDNIPLTRLAAVTGVYGVSFMIALVNASIVAAFFSRPTRRSRMLSIAFAAALLLQLGTFVSPRKLPAQQQAVLVQHNLSLDMYWTERILERTLAELHALSALPDVAPGSSSPRLIVWPESPAPFYDNNPEFRQSLTELAKTQNAYMVAGTVGTFARQPGPQDVEELANRAVLIAPSGEWIARYDKVHLVPFGEYIPFKSIFVFANKLTREVGNYRHGTERTVFPLGEHKVGVFICYESIFPDEIRRFAAGGAQAFINISNDGWFGQTGAPGQHLNMARMRAIENYRWVLRATNTGVTASIDPYGRVVAQAPRNIRTALVAPYNFESYTTFYTRHGDWFAYGCAIISLVLVFVKFRFRAGTIKG